MGLMLLEPNTGSCRWVLASQAGMLIRRGWLKSCHTHADVEKLGPDGHILH
jgi:hypothetical protein